MDLLSLNTPIIGENIFTVLTQHATSISRDFKAKVRNPLAAGRAVSIDICLLDPSAVARAFDVRFVTHWTPLKDEKGAVTAVTLTLSSTLK
jgi:hypothetical protein